MTDTHIHYRAGYRYQLARDYHIDTKIKPTRPIDTPYIALDLTGHLTVKGGYAWDGTSGPILDTDANLRGSLVHDAFYQLMRMRKLSSKKHKDKADKLFRSMCKDDGVLPPIAEVYYQTLKKLGKPSTDPSNARKRQRAP